MGIRTGFRGDGLGDVKTRTGTIVKKLRRQLCLKCGETLFVSVLMDPNPGIDGDVDWSTDKIGRFMTCRKCGAKHDIEEWQNPPGHGGSWRIVGVRAN